MNKKLTKHKKKVSNSFLLKVAKANNDIYKTAKEICTPGAYSIIIEDRLRETFEFFEDYPTEEEAIKNMGRAFLKEYIFSMRCHVLYLPNRSYNPIYICSSWS
jgi:hypothetical protein